MLEDYLSACRLPGRPVEVAFYGGSFTALPPAMQRAYLQAVAPLRERGRVTALRVSTRPDAVTRQGLELLRGYGVTT
ncbi:MAG: radical SAM protein, partial [Syntrophomonadaceae bacterium]|nr:radical SAM protein [Syntrophomonadaceae bacterium]